MSLVSTALVTATVNQTQAALLAYEGFEYTTATLAGQNGGTGFTGTWKSDLALTTDSSTPVLSTSLDVSPDYQPAPAGGSARLTGVSAIFRELAPAAQLALDGDQDYYLSFITERSADGVHRMRLYSGATLQLNLQVTSGGNISIQGMGANSSITGLPVTTGEQMLWVVKIAARSGATNDQVFVQVYTPDSTLPIAEPDTWLGASNAVVKTGTLDRIEFDTPAAGMGLTVDEIRIGTTWTDVTGVVPEPASAALSAGALLLLAGRRRIASRR